MPFHTFLVPDQKLIYTVATDVFSDEDIRKLMILIGEVENFGNYRQLHDLKAVTQMTILPETMLAITGFLETSNDLITSAYVIGTGIEPHIIQDFLGTVSGAVRRIRVTGDLNNALEWLGIHDFEPPTPSVFDGSISTV